MSAGQDDGPYLGNLKTSWRSEKQVHYRGPKHLLTVGPPGSLKSVGLIASNLATLKRSVIILDPKGEISAITARVRAKMGRVVMLNPFGVFADRLPHLKSHGYNPLSDLDPASPRYADDCFALAEAWMPDEGEKQRFFIEGAKNLLAALIMFLRLTLGPAATLSDVRRALTAPTVMGKTGPESGFLRTLADMVACDYEPIFNLAGRIMERIRDKNSMNTSLQDVIETVVTATRPVDSPLLAADLKGPGFDWSVLRREITTVYLVLPTREMSTHALWIRMVISAALNALYEPPDIDQPSPLPPVMFLLEEFFQIGRVPAIERALPIARASNIQLWPFVQDLGQLGALYGEKLWHSFLTGAGAITSFAPKDEFTSEFLSRFCGQRTEIIESLNISEGRMGRNRSPQQRPMFRPEELRAMPYGQMLCMVEPEASPFFTTVRPYPETPYGRGLDPNPYYRKPAA